MSYVTNIMICGLCASDHLEEINTWLKKNYVEKYGRNYEVVMKEIGDYAGGNKKMETDILAGAFNYLDLEDFIKFLKNIDWDNETDLFIQDEDDDTFTKTPLATYEDVINKLRR